MIFREGMERKQLSRAFLEWLYHKTVIELSASSQLLRCNLQKGSFKPTLGDVVGPNLEKLRNAYHDKWYRDHKQTSSDEATHCIFEMYDGQWGMVRPTCAVDWNGVIDIGDNRIRKCCPNTPAYESAFCASCMSNLLTCKRPAEIEDEVRIDYLAELQKMKYLKQDEYFVEGILGHKLVNNMDHYEVKWVGYEDTTWEPRKMLSKQMRKLLDDKQALGKDQFLTSEELWATFFTDKSSSIFDTKRAKRAFSCNID